MKTRLMLALLLLPLSALAGTANITWSMPTQYSDSTPLPVADLASTTVEYGSCVGTAFGTKAGQVVTASPSTTASVLNLNPGVYCFRAFVTTTAAKGGVSSATSSVASGTVPFSVPGVPTAITVTIL